MQYPLISENEFDAYSEYRLVSELQIMSECEHSVRICDVPLQHDYESRTKKEKHANRDKKASRGNSYEV